MRYVIQHHTMFEGWVVTGSCQNKDGETEVMTFPSKEEAEEDMRECLIREEYPYSKEEFRIVPFLSDVKLSKDLKGSIDVAPEFHDQAEEGQG
ncbi:hypothetical protein IIA15_00340 [candidate division TA06 bacterium]|nr:hypothetical protein [candidate division TA06 bacterium]